MGAEQGRAGEERLEQGPAEGRAGSSGGQSGEQRMAERGAADGRAGSSGG